MDPSDMFNCRITRKKHVNESGFGGFSPRFLEGG